MRTSLNHQLNFVTYFPSEQNLSGVLEVQDLRILIIQIMLGRDLKFCFNRVVLRELQFCYFLPNNWFSLAHFTIFYKFNILQFAVQISFFREQPFALALGFSNLIPIHPFPSKMGSFAKTKFEYLCPLFLYTTSLCTRSDHKIQTRSLREISSFFIHTIRWLNNPNICFHTLFLIDDGHPSKTRKGL